MQPDLDPPPVFRTKDPREAIAELIRLGQSREEAQETTGLAEDHGYCETADRTAYVYRGGFSVDTHYYEVGGGETDAA